jgi:hypothetical protein
MDLKGRAGKKGRKDKPQGRLHIRYTYSTEWVGIRSPPYSPRVLC